MKATIKKEGHNTISINVLGFKPQIVSYEDFFSNTIFNSNKYCYVDSIEYEEASIVFNKIDPKYNHIFKDRYTISFELTSDEKFMKLLNEFFSEYEEKKEQLNNEAIKRLSDPQYDWFIRNIASDTYKEYCETGKIKIFYWDEIALRVADMCEHNKKWVSQYTSDDVTYPVYGTKIANILRIISGASVMTTVSSLIASFVLSPTNAENPEQAAAFFLPIVAISIVGGTICYKLSGDLDNLYASKKLNEISKTLEDQLNINQLLDGPILPQPRLTL